MTSKTGKCLAAIILSFASCCCTLAQSAEKQSVRILLLSLENKFGVVFTYADETIKGITVQPAPRLSGINEHLQYLRNETGLIFEPINERFIAIRKPLVSQSAKRCAFLRSSENGEPIPGATIQFGNNFTVTTESGFFEIESPEPVTLTIRSLGYQLLEISSGELSEKCITLVMKVNRTTLDEITVSDVLTTGMERKSDGSITVRNKLLGILPGFPQPDAIQTLQYLPGVISILESAAELNIRGGTNDQNLFLLDGIKIYQTGHFFGLISGINPHITEKVNFIKNGTSAWYGDGVSGTIAITTDDQLSTQTQGSAGINLLYADGFLQIPLTKKLSIHASGRHSLPSSWKTPTFRQYYRRAFSNTELSDKASADLTRNEEFSFYDASLKLLYDISSRDKLRVSTFTISNALNYDEQGEFSGRPLQRKSSLGQQSLGSSIHYAHLWSDRVKTQAEGYFSKYSLDAINQNIAQDQQLTQGNEVLETGIRLTSLIEVNQQWHIQSGYQFYETGITNADQINNPSFERRVKEVMRTHALFAESGITLHEDRTNIRFGLRTNYYDKLNRLTVEPRLVVSRALSKTITVELLGEQKSQSSLQVIDAPNDFFGIEKSRWLLANDDDVPLLISRQAAAGMIFKKGDWLVNSEVFYKDVDGIISSSQGFQNQFQYVRTSGGYTATGFDVLVNHHSSRSLQWLRYSLLKSNYEFPEFTPAVFPNSADVRHIITGGLSYRFSKVELSAGGNWYTGRPVTRPVAGEEVVSGSINYDLPNGVRLKNYMRIDLSTRWHFYTGVKVKYHLGLSLWNITNHKNILDEHYLVNSENQAEKIEQRGLAFTPNIFLRFDF
ncbi:MAG TPA: TonB-dependent receptor plug domain-containing protein [Cyclobacteriaceae bacterium]|nr:TonB-dependent receptor plug domain-containing protein [Cyclobacteriaceae bacterium]HRJ82013.1 TonB-dependent receptor plug domain-containing protein [Cyclobacteriaceae bacterium]